LYYVPSGAPIGNETPGDWTSDGFVKVNNIQVRRQSLILEARRMVAVYIDHEFQLRPAQQLLPGEKETRPVFVVIAAELAGDAFSSKTIEAVTSRIFLDARDSLADLVPDYWKSCIRSGLIDKSQNCQFSPDILSIPGVISS
jgi:hypothetical protein